MAARKNPKHQQATRDRIQTTQLINLLQKNAKGELELNPVRQKSIEILLRKALPDLSAVEHQGLDEVRYVIAAPEVSQSADDWLAATRPSENTQEQAETSSEPGTKLN